jgi:hypothetical protein
MQTYFDPKRFSYLQLFSAKVGWGKSQPSLYVPPGLGIEELEHATWHLKGSIMELKCSVTKALRRGGHPVTLQLKRFLCADEDSCTAPKRVKTGNDFLKHDGK